MSWLLLPLLVLIFSTPTPAQTPSPLTPDRRFIISFCARHPERCPPGTKPPSRAESPALAAEEAAARRAEKETAERVAHSTCADLLPEVRGLWDKNEAGDMLTATEQAVWRVWKAACEKRPYTSLGPRP